MQDQKQQSIQFKDILLARCPSCKKGSITDGIFGIHKRCLECDYDFHPESGYFLGSMMVSYLLTAILMIPPLIIMKFWDADIGVLLSFPFLQLIIVGPLSLYYSRVVWVHLDYSIKNRLN